MANTGILADGYFDLATDPDEGDFAQGLEDIVSLIKETPGGTLRRTTAIALESDAFAPVKDYCAHIIDTQSAAASDDLVTITSTGIRDGFIISISIANAARIITVKNSGNITTLDGLDLILNSTTFELWLRWDSTLGKWRQVTNPETTIRLNKIPGGLPSSALTISGGSVTATRGFHTITSESGVTDDLDLIAQTTLTQDTSLLYLKATTGHTITVRHNQVGTGKIITPDGTNLSLTGNRALLLAKNGTQWDVIGKLGSWVKNLSEGGLNNVLAATARTVPVGDGTKYVDSAAPSAGLQYLRSNAGNTALEWAASSSGGIVIKSADTAKTSDTTLADDPHLTLAVAASTTYSFIMRLFVTGGGTNSDLNMQLVGPSGSTIAWTGVEVMEPGAAYGIAGSTPQTFQLSGSIRIIEIAGTITTTGTAGNLKLQWAQAASTAQTVTVRRGSSFSLAAA